MVYNVEIEIDMQLLVVNHHPTDITGSFWNPFLFP